MTTEDIMLCGCVAIAFAGYALFAWTVWRK